MSLSDFDELDKRIIELLCRSSQGSYRQLAKQLDVHPTTLIQRVKNLESKGVINGYRASIDYMKLGFEYMGMVSVIAENVVTVKKTSTAVILNITKDPFTYIPPILGER